MANILAVKEQTKKYFTEHDWKTGIPQRDGWRLLEGTVSFETAPVKTAPNPKRPSILVPKKEQPNTADTVENNVVQLNPESMGSHFEGRKADGEEDEENKGSEEHGNEGNTGGNKELQTSKDLNVVDSVKKIEGIETAEELSKFVEGDNRITIINAFAKQSKKINGQV